VVHVESNEAGLEQRLSSLQAQIESLRQAAPDDARPLEQRLSTLTEFSADILKQWAATADRHARAVIQLETQLREIGDAGNRLQQDASQRLQELERIVQQEWGALRDIHEAPVRQLVEQAANLTEVCIATANSAQHGFDRAEARLAALEGDFHRTTSELTRELHVVLDEVRQLLAGNQRQLPGESAAWPLEGVTRLHQQLREQPSTPASPRALPAAVFPEPPAPFTSISPSSISPTSFDSQPVSERAGEPLRSAPFSWPIVAVIAAILVVGAVLAWRLQRDVRAVTERAAQTQRESQVAAQKASREAAERQEAATRQLESAQALAARAQTIGDVMAAPDLIRYTLANTGLPPGASGQVLFSRSRGFVFSASGLPAPPPATTYQIWLLTRVGAVSAATFVPDSAGRVTITTTPNVPRAVVGAMVTMEPSGGAAVPSGDRVLVRLPVAPPES
jgi:hypothetical protein